MKALFIVLNQSTYLDDILSVLVEKGVKGATILESQGMASAMIQHEKHLPFFGALKTALEGSKPYNHTIFSVIHDDQLVELVVLAIDELLKNIKKPGVGFMFTMPVDHIYPLGSK